MLVMTMTAQGETKATTTNATITTTTLSVLLRIPLVNNTDDTRLDASISSSIGQLTKCGGDGGNLMVVELRYG